MPHDSPVVFEDCYGARAEDYARYRPRYPYTLYEALAAWIPGRARGWDCATGNGQAAVALTRHLDRVVATDASADQLARAVPHPQIAYRCELAERTSLPDASVDLVTIAAALHWLDLPAFYGEVRRVLRPGGVFAAWTYGLDVESTPRVNDVTTHYLEEVLGPYTRPQLQHVATRYRELAFPFPELPLRPMEIVATWTLADLVGMLNTWSAALAFRSRHGHLATDLVLPELTAAWIADGPVDAPRPIRLPLYTRVGHAPTAG